MVFRFGRSDTLERPEPRSIKKCSKIDETKMFDYIKLNMLQFGDLGNFH